MQRATMRHNIFDVFLSLDQLVLSRSRRCLETIGKSWIAFYRFDRLRKLV